MCNKNGSIPLVRNCIISGNTANVGGGIYTDCPHLIDYNDVCCNFPDNYSGGCFPGTNDITPPKDPMFADPFGGDYHLQGGSPCIDTGDNGAVPPGVTTDRDGNTRILDGNGDATARVDMGAYEYVCLDEDGDNWTTCKGDCDDADATVYPYAPEICDGKDNNCDGNIPANEGDTDGDGTLDCADGCLNDPDKTEPGDCGCGIPDTDSDDDGSPSCFDCDDNDPNNWPGNMEICDGQDNNCDGQVDEGCAVEEADLRCVQYRFGAPAPGYSFAGWPIFEGWLDVRIENNGAGDAFNVTAEVMGWPANVTVPDATVYVGNIPAGESAWSTAPDPSFTTRVNMAEPADPNEGVFWRIGYDDADGVHHVVENVPQFPS